MSDEKSPLWRENSFKPGNTAGQNTSGRRSREVGALARRYTVDSIRALVDVVRLPAATHATPKIAAARMLLEIGHSGLFKADAAGDGGDAGRLHLLALQELAPPGSVAAIRPADGEDGGPALDAEALIGGDGFYGLLPAPDDDAPDEAMPLWDAWKARKAMVTARDAELTGANEPTTTDSGESESESGPGEGSQ